MSQSSKSSTRRPNNVTLHMEYYSEELSPAQIDRHNKIRQKKKELKEVIEKWRRSEGQLVTRISDDCFVLERLCTPLHPQQHVSKSVASGDVGAPTIVGDHPVVLQARSIPSLLPHQPVILPKTISQPQTSARGQPNNSVISQPCNLLMRDTRRTRVMGVVSGSQPTSLGPHLVTTTASMPKAVPISSVVAPSLKVSSPVQTPGVIVNRNIPLQSNSVLQSPTIRPVSTVGIVLQSTTAPPPRYPATVRVPLTENASASRPVNTTAGTMMTQQTPSIRVAHYAPRSSPIRAPRIPPSPTLRSRSHVSVVRNVRPVMPAPRVTVPAPRVTVPARSLVVQPPAAVRPPANKNPSRIPNNSQVPPPSNASGAPVVDLTCDDSPNEVPADTREITFNKLIGKTFPSLVVTARPSIRVKEVTALQLTEDRSELDKKVKKVLMFTPTKFSEWMIQEGLVRSDQYCQTHITPYGEKIPLKLGIYSDVSKFPFSGGYVWISDCCPQRFVSVFSGSIFEGSPHPPTVLVKLIYHWVVQTSIQNVIQWVKVDNLYVKGFYTHLRSICTAAVAEKFSRMGGPNKKIEIGVVSLGITAHGGKSRNVKVEVLGVMDPVSKIVRLQAVEPIKMGDPDYQTRFIKLLNPVKEWVDKDSIILTDYTVDKPTLQSIGFKTIFQVPAGEEQTTQNKYSNHNVMNYLRNNVPKMFQNTLSLLSRQIIQQFLDELVWREQWGYTPYKAFHNLLTHMAEQVKLDSNDTLLTRLSKIASDPFKCWTYNVLKTPPFTPAGISFPPKSRDSEIQQPAVQVPGGTSAPPPVSGIDLLPQSIREIEPTEPAKPLKSAKKRSSVSIEPSDTKRIAIDGASQTVAPPLGAKKLSGESSDAKRIAVDDATQSVTPPLPKEMVQLETFYYGQLPGEKHIIETEHKDTDPIACQSCNQTFPNNTELLQHLICHAQPDGKDLPEININLQCRYCLKFFASQYALQVHLEEIHFNNSTSLVCRICERKFRTRVTLISHMHTTHFQLEMPYECGICKFRSSLHKDVINHFHETHINTMKLQCPFCLKVVALSSGNQILTQNIFFFINHLQKHQRKSLCVKCSTCVLWFTHKDILKEHQMRDHRSLCDRNDEVIPFMNITGFDIMMPKPPPTTFNPCQMISISKNVFINSPNSKNFFTSKSFSDLKINSVDDDAYCNECEGIIIEDSHFASEVACTCCSYVTCCTKAMMDHVLVFHQDSIKNRLKFNMGRVIRLEKPMYCVCGFRSSSGNCIAKHLALCGEKTAYPEPYCPKIVELSSASFPPLVTLDDTDNVSEDPSDRWLKAFVPSRKEDSDNSRSASDKKLLEPQEKFTEQSEPPSVLNILGLMQKPSSDAAVVNSSAPDSPKVDEKPFADQEERETNPP